MRDATLAAIALAVLLPGSLGSLTPPDLADAAVLVWDDATPGPDDLPEHPFAQSTASQDAPIENACDPENEGCCEKTGKSGSMPWHGTVDCGFTCPPAAALYVSVTSHDREWGIPDVWGGAWCGGAEADCPRTKMHCQGASVGVTQYEDAGNCWGKSSDTVASDITIICLNTVSLFLPCSWQELIPSPEEAKRCGWTLTCESMLVGDEGHQWGISYCKVEDGKGNEYEEVCIHSGGSRQCEPVDIPIACLDSLKAPQSECQVDPCTLVPSLLFDSQAQSLECAPSGPCDHNAYSAEIDPCDPSLPRIRNCQDVVALLGQFETDPCEPPGLDPDECESWVTPVLAREAVCQLLNGEITASQGALLGLAPGETLAVVSGNSTVATGYVCTHIGCRAVETWTDGRRIGIGARQ